MGCALAIIRSGEAPRPLTYSLTLFTLCSLLSRLPAGRRRPCIMELSQVTSPVKIRLLFTPEDGVLRRSLAVLAIAAIVVAALVATSSVHPQRPASAQQARMS
jgi:hypothetical protein